MTDQQNSAAEPTQLAPMPEDWQRALAVVAHPDDLEYGCAGAIAAWTDAGRDVVYVLATRGEAGIDTLAPAEAAPLREREQRASAAGLRGPRNVTRPAPSGFASCTAKLPTPPAAACTISSTRSSRCCGPSRPSHSFRLPSCGSASATPCRC